MQVVFQNLKACDKYKHALLVVVFYSGLYSFFFARVLFSDFLLAPGDAFLQSVPAFYAPRTLWTDLLAAGFPIGADPTVQSWYPLSRIFSLFPNSWNIFVITAYILASCFAYGYVYTLTYSRLAASVSGIVYGMSGFMMAHLGHTSMIHSAAWLPLLIWALDLLRKQFSTFWFFIACLTVAFSSLGGHSQIFAFAMVLSSLYVTVFGWNASIGRYKYYSQYIVIVVLGLGLSAIQLIPTVELVNQSIRNQLSFDQFVSYSLPVHQSISLIFPHLFGNVPDSLYRLPYFGQWNIAEMTSYVGLVTLILAIVGFLGWGKKQITWFWLSVCLLSFLLALGDATPLANFMYQIPIFNKFRVPTRHFLEMSLGFSVLAGLGIASMQRQRRTRVVVLVSLGIMICAVLGVLIISGTWKTIAPGQGVNGAKLLPWANPAVGIPLGLLLVAVFVILYWGRKPQSYFRKILLIAIVVIDLGSFGWFCEWRHHSPHKTALETKPLLKKYKFGLKAENQRMLPVRGVFSSMNEIPPNISRLWGIPNASYFGPLILERICKMLSMTPAGALVKNSWAWEVNRALDIMAIKYIFLPDKALRPSAFIGENGVLWSEENLPFTIGRGCGVSRPDFLKIELPKSVNATSIAIVSAMACSGAIENGTAVADIVLSDIANGYQSLSLCAGTHTSEWSYDCEDETRRIKHDRAPVFKSFSAVRNSRPCKGHSYVCVLHLDRRTEIKDIKISWTSLSGSIAITKMTLLDEKGGEYYPVPGVFSCLSTNSRWRYVENIDSTVVYENLKAMPRVWLVPEVISATPDAILQSIKSSKLPDGRNYDPSKIALVEEDLDFNVNKAEMTGTAKLVNLSNSALEIRTNTEKPSFLVTSDVYYPGWKATVDGLATPIFQTNYVLRGVMVPAGEHVVRFEYRPKSFYFGVMISTLSLFLLIGLLVFEFRKKKRLKN